MSGKASAEGRDLAPEDDWRPGEDREFSQPREGLEAGVTADDFTRDGERAAGARAPRPGATDDFPAGPGAGRNPATDDVRERQSTPAHERQRLADEGDAARPRQ